MVLLDKRRAALWIKIGAALLAVIFVLSFMPLFRSGGAADFFKTLFQSKKAPSEQAQLIKLKQDVEKNPKDAKALVKLADYLYDHQKPEEAITYYTKALEIDPNNIDTRVDMGTAYYDIQQFDKALEAFRAATDANPNHAIAWYNMGVVFKAKNDTVNQKFAWERFLAIQPTGEQADQVRQELANLK